MGQKKYEDAKSFEELAAQESLEETKDAPAEEVVAETPEEVTDNEDTGGVTEEVTDDTTEKTE